MKIVISGVSRLVAKTKQKINAADQALARGNSRMALHLRNKMMDKAPRKGDVDHPYATGQLYGGIEAIMPGGTIKTDELTIQMSKTDAAVISKAPHSRFVDEGTTRMDAIPYFDVTIEEEKDEYPKILREEMRR